MAASHNLAAHFLARIDARGDKPFLLRAEARREETWTYARLGQAARDLAAGLLDLGVRRGDPVGLVEDSGARWLQADLACLAIGALTVPRGTDTPACDLVEILEHSGARVVLFRSVERARAFVAQRESLGIRPAGTAGRETTDRFLAVILHANRDGALPPGMLSREVVEARGRALREREPSCVDDEVARGRAEDLATILYTSGTTGRPKGVMLRHGNLLANLRQIRPRLDMRRGEVLLSILPVWHTFERILEYAALDDGMAIAFTSPRTLVEDLARFRPSAFAAVPRVWELIRGRFLDAVARKGRRLEALCRATEASSLAVRIARGEILAPPQAPARGGGSPRAKDHVLHAIGERLFWRRLRAVLGGRLRLPVSGGATLPACVDSFFAAAGVPLLNGYGLTETSPVLAVRSPGACRLGTIGAPLDETEVSIRDERGRPVPPGDPGTLHVRGPQVMAGYYRDEERTRAVLSPDGWFDTGDLCRQLPDGDLCITGRRKDTIVLAGGENVEPEAIESRLLQSPFIRQALVLGQDQKVLGALVVPDLEAMRRRVPALARGTPPGKHDEKTIEAVVHGEIRRIQEEERATRPEERVRRFRVVPGEFRIEDGTLTPTLKVRRQAAITRYRNLVQDMFPESREAATPSPAAREAAHAASSVSGGSPDIAPAENR